MATAVAWPQVVSAKCTDIESCREEGERRIEEQERAAGPIVNLERGVRYRESKQGAGDVTLREGDEALITFQV